MRKKRSRLSWAINVTAPWCLGIGLLVSISADAGQNAMIGGSFAAVTGHAASEPGDLVPEQALLLSGDFGMNSDKPIVLASAEAGGADDFIHNDEIEPRADLKRNAGGILPVIDRSHKGDPLVGLRPTFDSHLRDRHGLAALRDAQMIGPHDDTMPAAGFSLQDKGEPLDSTASFSPWGEGDDPQEALDDAPHAASEAIAMRPAALKLRLLQGATPPVSRAEALSSTTPAPADGTPVEVTFTPQQMMPNASIVPRDGGQPDYAALLTGDHGARERKCLAEAVYFEARSEPTEGQAAVAQVVLNRATSGLYPASICGVVYQNRTHYKACQFSFACEGKSLHVTEPDAWATAERIADDVLAGKTYVSDVGGATHYHANYVRPGWSRRLVKMDVIGHHIFYKLRPGQT